MAQATLKNLDRAAFTQAVAQKAQTLATSDVDKCVETALGLIADNLSEYGTETFAAQLPDGFRASVDRHRNKIEHSVQEMTELLAKGASVGATTADNILFATLEVLHKSLDENERSRILAQLPTDLAHMFRGSMPGQKRGAF